MVTDNNERAKDRVKILVNESVLVQSPENIYVNVPVAIHQIAWQNELNGILLGLGLAGLRVKVLPMTKEQKKAILKAIK
jgi:hypothetical protein